MKHELESVYQDVEKKKDDLAKEKINELINQYVESSMTIYELAAAINKVYKDRWEKDQTPSNETEQRINGTRVISDYFYVIWDRHGSCVSYEKRINGFETRSSTMVNFYDKNGKFVAAWPMDMIARIERIENTDLQQVGGD